MYQRRAFHVQQQNIHPNRWSNDGITFRVTDRQHIHVRTGNESDTNLWTDGPILDTLRRRHFCIHQSVYRKSTNNNIYINWNAYSPRSWKIGTLRNLLRRAITVCSTKDKLQAEIKHLQDAFCDINEYPQKLVKSITNDELAKHQQQETENELRGNTDTNDTNENTNEDEPRTVQLSLPYAGNHGEILTKKLKRSIEAKSKKLKIRITYTPSKLGSRFQIKDKTKLEHQHNVSYHVDCGNQRCPSNYVGQTKRRMGVRTDNHHGTDKKSHVLAHSKKNEAPPSNAKERKNPW